MDSQETPCKQYFYVEYNGPYGSVINNPIRYICCELSRRQVEGREAHTDGPPEKLKLRQEHYLLHAVGPRWISVELTDDTMSIDEALLHFTRLIERFGDTEFSYSESLEMGLERPGKFPTPNDFK